ncbi:MAG: hypothetical protein ABI790_06815 [Betaproteobacteria bacterium]
MKDILNVHSRQSNSFVATAFGVAVTVLLIGGYEATHAVADSEMAVAQTVQSGAVARMDTIVVTATRG